MDVMHVAELWRYPIKSLRGEQIRETEITPLGIPKDREIVVVRSVNGRVLTSRTRPRLLGLRGSLTQDGTATINDLPWDSDEALALVQNAAEQEVTLAQVHGTERFDVLPLLIATDGTIEHLQIDRRRLRPNIIIGGVNGLDERGWPGRVIAIGQVRIWAQKLRHRCVMTTFDPDTQEQDKSVLSNIIRDLDGTAALDCAVIEPGVIRIGDRVEVL